MEISTGLCLEFWRRAGEGKLSASTYRGLKSGYDWLKHKLTETIFTFKQHYFACKSLLMAQTNLYEDHSGVAQGVFDNPYDALIEASHNEAVSNASTQ